MNEVMQIALCLLALIIFRSVIIQIITECFYDIIRSPFPIFAISYAFYIIV